MNPLLFVYPLSFPSGIKKKEEMHKPLSYNVKKYIKAHCVYIMKWRAEPLSG